MERPQPEDEAPRPSARTMSAAAAIEANEDKLSLEGDLYTYAYVAALEPPYQSGKGSPMRETLSVLGPVAVMLAVSLIQILMGWAVYLHVLNDLIHTHTRPLHTAYEMFIGSNITVPLHTVEALCGEWEDQEMKKGIADGPLSTIKMPDGTEYSSDERYSLFYNLKQPTRTWDYGRLGSDRSVLDDVMFVISEGTTLNPFTNSGYSLLFVTTLAMFFFSIFSEFREIAKFAQMLGYLPLSSDTSSKRDRVNAIWAYDHKSEVFALIGQNQRARVVGMVAVVARAAVALFLLWLGGIFLTFTTLKIDLILNALGLVFLLDLDKIVYLGSVMTHTQKFISEVAPVAYHATDSQTRSGKISNFQYWIPVLMFPCIFGASMLVRAYQVHTFQRYFRMTAAICLFAGPTQPFARKDVVQPVAGFCDSLLGVSCAPHVSSESSLEKHGYCVLTDQTTMSRPTVEMYLDDPTLFAGRYERDGTERSWVDWGEANPLLYESRRWMEGPYQDLLRKQCLQMYQRRVAPDDVMVDDDVGETMDGAPFLCAREPIFEAVFGKVVARVDQTNSIGPIQKHRHEGGLSHEAMEQVRDLSDPVVVRAIDACKTSRVKLPTPAPPESAGPEPAAAGPSFRLEDASRVRLLNQRAGGSQKLRAGRARHRRHGGSDHHAADDA